jgi:hypothetical protein
MRDKDKLGKIAYNKANELQFLIDTLSATTIGTIKSDISSLESRIAFLESKLSSYEDHTHSYTDNDITKSTGGIE